MVALVKTSPGIGNIEIQDIPIPQIGPNDVLIKVEYGAVCATDIHIYYDRFPNSPPFVLGHEFSGTVCKTGSSVTGFVPGDPVVSENNPFACGTCRTCRLGYPNLCTQKRAMGIHSDGSFAGYIKLPAHLLHRIPENVSLEEAVLCEPLAVAVHSVAARATVEKGDYVVVFGAGAIGILSAQVAAALGAETVLVAGTSWDEGNRFTCIENLGIGPVNIEKENLDDIVFSQTGGYGADVVVEASGSSAAVLQGIRLLRRAGRMTISGITGKKELPVPWDDLTAKGATLFFSYSSLRADWNSGLTLLNEKKIKTLPLITHRFTLGEWKSAFNVLESLEAIRPLLKIRND